MSDRRHGRSCDRLGVLRIHCAAPRTARDVTSLLSSKSPFSPARPCHCSSQLNVFCQKIKRDPCVAGSSYFISLFRIDNHLCLSLAAPFAPITTLVAAPFAATIRPVFRGGRYHSRPLGILIPPSISTVAKYLSSAASGSSGSKYFSTSSYLMPAMRASFSSGIRAMRLSFSSGMAGHRGRLSLRPNG